MMPALTCLGDATTHGGEVITASSTMYVEGIQVALVGDRVSCPLHGTNQIQQGDPTLFNNGVQVVVHDCVCECGCRIISFRNERVE
ncbi:PAAR domain-containing protein [Pantoea sp. SM3]|uniref:PAAR domain-containing protein n=1 Tax=Pantoea sp. SM3 TaxID=1628192 RepID=UPI00350F1BEA